MKDVITNVTALVTAGASALGAVAAYIQARNARREIREGKTSAALKDRYILIARWAFAGAVLALVALDVAIYQGLGRRSLIIIVSIAAVVLIAFGTAMGYSTAARVSSSKIQIDAQRLKGHWNGTFGEAYFTVEGNRVKAVYDAWDGRIQGVIHEGIFDGWWNQLPTRSPPDNAGQVHFQMRRELGSLRLDGTWRFGREGDWMFWEMTKVDEDIPVSAQAKFEESSTFTTGWELG